MYLANLIFGQYTDFILKIFQAAGVVFSHVTQAYKPF